MTSALKSYFGMSKQSAKGSTVSTDSLFKYFYFSRGTGMTPAPIVLPLEQEVGSGSLTRDMTSVGLTTTGGAEFIPRPDSLGLMLLGALGDVSTVTGASYNTHTFKFATDEFDIPYYTMRRESAVGGEVFPDVRVAALGFQFRAANYLRATMGLLGASEPTYASSVSWSPTDYMDSTPPMLTCKGAFELPTGTSLKVLRGSLLINNAMPLQEQMIVGSYTPDDIELTARGVVVSATVKVNKALYEKMMYDPAQGGSWQPDILKEADLNIKFQTASDVGGSQPYEVSFHFNGDNQASGTANVAWSVQPVALMGARQVLMQVTGMVLADTTSYADGPFSAQLINDTASY